MVKITTIGCANPKLRLTQQESWENLQRLRDLSSREKQFYKRFLLDEAIEARYIALDNIEDIFCCEQDRIIERYQNSAAEISTLSSQEALHKANVKPADIEFLATTSCTGYLCPGLSSYIIEGAGLPATTSILDIQGMGCGAALPGLASAVSYLSASPKKSYALVTSTEICSAAIQWEDDLALILSNSIFGDGSACAVLTNDPLAAGPSIVDYSVLNIPESRDALRFTVRNSKLYNVLSPKVATMAADAVNQIVDRILEKNGLQQEDIGFWAIHPGGRKVLSAIAEKLDLTSEDLRFSNGVLRDYGNMSSPSLLFVLRNIIESKLPQPGDYGFALAFGAGFSAFGMLLRW